jgi:RNA polymerase sigma factor (TIGR02999 family)
MLKGMSDVTRILCQVERGDPQAASQLLSLVYDELRRLAARKMAHEPAGLTLNATALVHEAYLRLVGGDDEQHWDGRHHFFAAAAEAMRRILIDNARRRKSIKRGGQLARHALQEGDAAAESSDLDELLALDEALGKLARDEPELARLVELREAPLGLCTGLVTTGNGSSLKGAGVRARAGSQRESGRIGTWSGPRGGRISHIDMIARCRSARGRSGGW